MTKKQQEKLVKDLGKNYIEKLFLQGWDIEFKISDDPNDEGVIGTCRANGLYKWAKITIYQDAFNEDNNIKHVVKHELCHCLTSDTKNISYDLLNARFRTHIEIDGANEVLTEWISKLVKD